INAYGWNPNATAKDAIIGNIIEAVAVFDVISVRKITSVATTAITIMRLTPCKLDNCSPIQSDKPDSTNPEAIASTPPNNSKIPQGNSTAVSQSRKRPPALLTDGIINNRTATTIAITPSLKPSINLAKKNDLVIQENAAKQNTVNTSFSSM